MGFVYVFNGNDQAVRLALPTGITSPIQPPSATSAAPYTPFSLQVQRGQPPISGPAFLDGQTNDVIVETRDQNAQTAQLPVPPLGQGTDDLWLYVFFDVLLLIQTDGKVSAQVPLRWNAPSLSKPTSEGF
jgi:hypothetical protein